MKLSEYIVKEYNKGHSALSEEDVEKWIVEWYTSEIHWQGKPKQPPAWLADWKRKPERSVVEQERCGIDEG